MIPGRLYHVALMGFAACQFAACSPFQYAVGGTGAYIFLKEDDVNLTERHYAAADYLYQQARYDLRQGSRIKALPLTDMDTAAMTSALGKRISAEVGTRFRQLGYAVDLTAVGEEGALAEPQPPVRKPHFILAGTYQRHRLDIGVSLKLTRADTGRIVAQFDYTMPTDSAVRKAASPETEITRLPQQPPKQEQKPTGLAR